MKKFYKLFVCLAIVACFFILPVTNRTAKADDSVYLGGFAAGFSIKSRGAEIVGLSDVITKYGLVSPSKQCGIEIGDKLMSIDGIEINCSKDIENALKNFKGENVVLVIKRNDEKIIKEVQPVEDMSGEFKLGLFIRDNLNGVGTMTFIKKNGEFMALGHPIVEEDNSLTEIVSGELYKCSIIGVNKGVRGKAGELKGIFIKDDCIGEISRNLNQGLRGKLSSDFDFSILKEVNLGTAKMGSAKIVTSVNGVEPKTYDIMIVKTENGDENGKNYVIKVIDEELLGIAGGIVQGMSGSPIIQDGKLVGAVTHVFLNDPTRGYGISIDNMLGTK